MQPLTAMYIAREESVLAPYLHDIHQFLLLTPDEEADVARRARHGDPEARRTLICANLRFVIMVALQYQRRGLSLADLINEGNYGLMKAVQRFDETRGFTFISYAVWWIRRAILQALARQTRIVRLPSHRIGTITKMNRVRARLAQQYERAPTPDELAEALHLDVEDVREALQNAQHAVSMDAPVKEDKENCLLDVLPNDEDPAPDDRLLDESIKIDLERALGLLHPREAEILRLYFGIGRERSLTLEEIGDRFSMTRERIRQIKEKALEKLRRHYTLSSLRNDGAR